MPSYERRTFGYIISEARKNVGLSQKQLAALIKKENGEAISPQYLNDIEHDRRNPPSEYIIKQLASKLNLEKDFLMFVSGSLPEDIRKIGLARPETIGQAFSLFRKAKKED
ncbi:MAG: helix-turn-helix domain-containing protein [Pyrinomonadaceae bacterium]